MVLHDDLGGGAHPRVVASPWLDLVEQVLIYSLVIGGKRGLDEPGVGLWESLVINSLVRPEALRLPRGR